MNTNTTTTAKSTATFPETITFKVGDQVRFNYGTDVFPGTVVEVGPRKVVVQKDSFEKDPEWNMDFIPGGFVGHVANNHDQRNIVTRDEEGALVEFTLKFPTKAIREYNNIEPNTRGVYTQKGTGYRGPQLRQGWGAFRDYNY